MRKAISLAHLPPCCQINCGDIHVLLGRETQWQEVESENPGLFSPRSPGKAALQPASCGGVWRERVPEGPGWWDGLRRVGTCVCPLGGGTREGVTRWGTDGTDRSKLAPYKSQVVSHQLFS